MSCLLLLVASLPLLLSSDHGVIILGGEGPDGPVDTVSVLTENGWCPSENVIIPPLPLAASGLTAHHDRLVGTHEGREYIMVCGFPGENACYQVSPLNQHFVWTPVGAEEEDIDMGVLEYVHSYSNRIKGGVDSMWMNKGTGDYQFLWSPMNRIDQDSGYEQMAGWYKDGLPNLVADFPALGTYDHLSCMATVQLLRNPSMITLSGGYSGTDSLNDLLLLSNDGNGDWQWHKNSISIGQNRSEHSCLHVEYMGELGLLLAGGFNIQKNGIVPSSLSSMVFLYAEEDNNSGLEESYDGMGNMNEARAAFGLANWGEEGLVALGGKKYGIVPGVTGSYLLLDSVEVWDKDETSWSSREEWIMETPLAGFGIVAMGSYSEVHGSEYCKM